MKLSELAAITRTEIHVYHSPGAVSEWIAEMRAPYGSCFFKKDSSDCMARGGTGWGATPTGAISNMLTNWLREDYRFFVVERTDGRQEFGLPREITQ